MKKTNLFILSILAGMSVGIGGIIYLISENKVIGATLFTLGLFTIVTRGFALFTGKVGNVFSNSPKYILTLAYIWLGNLVGAVFMGVLVNLTRLSKLIPKAYEVANVKLSDDLLSIFILAVFCNVLMYIAVDGFKTNEHEVGKYVGLFLGIIVFILCGFEHCVANMFYFTVAGVWSLKAVGYLLVMTIGNTVGGILIPAMMLIKTSKKGYNFN